MESIKSKGKRMNVPSVNKMLLEDLVYETARNDHEELKQGKKEVKGYPCGACKGTGIEVGSKLMCIACEGTGNDYEIHYGYEDGQLYGYVKQYGMESYKEYCKTCREAEAEITTSQRANRPLLRPFSLPKVIEMELLARGYSPDELRSGSSVRELAKIVQTEWPELMTTNLRF